MEKTWLYEKIDEAFGALSHMTVSGENILLAGEAMARLRDIARAMQEEREDGEKDGEDR